ncbi:MAG: type II toxin-antitoxin system ParD family antitoxin [Thermococci archaeon]|nr:type II toxin-antitoxin system ParD family antitoxin [Thermococci archaeon]
MTKMRIVSVQLPQNIINGIDELVRRGSYPNRSEVIRSALREFLRRELPRDTTGVPDYLIK